VAADLSKKKRLLPGWRLPRPVEPRIRRLPWTAKGCNDLGGGILGKRFSEGHGQILPQKKKYAMQKKDRDKRPQCRHSLRINQPHRTMKHNRLKIVITANNQTQHPTNQTTNKPTTKPTDTTKQKARVQAGYAL
jgi:hypothetical protein